MSPPLSPAALSASAERAMQKYYGFRELKKFQRDAVLACYRRQHCFIIKHTGAGKSLCYQLPSLMDKASGRFVLVISPLISLMQDQVHALMQRQIAAVLLGSASSYTWGDVLAGRYRLVYVSPEYVEKMVDTIAASKDRILLLAIDEVHCVSEWGHDFRPLYRKLYLLKRALSGVPVMGLTATCTMEVQSDVLHQLDLNIRDVLVLRSTINRTNLYYEVREKKGMQDDLGKLLAMPSVTLPRPQAKSRSEKTIDNAANTPDPLPFASTLIYVPTQRDAEEVASFLSDRGVQAAAYHAGLRPDRRLGVHEDFLQDKVQVVVATVAYGMGIDKPDIRRVIHYGLPRTLEAYVQQAGRAGRDGDLSECYLFWRDGDGATGRALILNDASTGKNTAEYTKHLMGLFGKVLEYAKAGSCRRDMLITYFREQQDYSQTAAAQGSSDDPQATKGICRKLADGSVTCSFCDMCRRRGRGRSSAPNTQVDISSEARILLAGVAACGGRFGITMPCKVVSGAGSTDVKQKGLTQLREYGSGRDRPVKFWTELGRILIREGLLTETVTSFSSAQSFMSTYMAVSVSPAGRRFIADRAKTLTTDQAERLFSFIRLSGEGGGGGERDAPRVAVSTAATLKRHEDDLYIVLRDIRSREGQRRKIAPVQILSNEVMRKAAGLRPTTIPQLRKTVEGIPETIDQTILQAMTTAIDKFCRDHYLTPDLNPPPPQPPPSRADAADGPSTSSRQRSAASSLPMKRKSSDSPSSADESGVCADRAVEHKRASIGERSERAERQEADEVRPRQLRAPVFDKDENSNAGDELLDMLA
ncbi:unnamed protein product [Vitrella brassicaformis CCMP3155]|uniref:DNA 3'-5' helicase n=5 Tax=Vitrella brassicaformis TaxID=1169539 RepID=A0A0G4FJZ2_VITBC|nr:unnamed protein product [Vitrella brassicaformis CCMP3155]|eukprot:CEM13711.1 unnamed protein product [Vitrella brassicaformis CCMP3155]